MTRQASAHVCMTNGHTFETQQQRTEEQWVAFRRQSIGVGSDRRGEYLRQAIALYFALHLMPMHPL
eukprot:36909-Eustigmatos_ZCMA.PRE.1